jgi:hypothetical protein
MSKVLSTLKQISDSMEELGNSMRREEQVYKAELADRLAKGLQGMPPSDITTSGWKTLV